MDILGRAIMDPLINTTSAQNLPHAIPNPQFALLNYFIPGFSVFASALHTYLGIDLNFFIPLLVAVFGLNFAWSYISASLWVWVDGYLMSSFRARTDDEIYNMLMLWISRQKFSQNSRRFLVNTDLYSRQSYLWRGHDNDSDDEDGSEGDELQVDILGQKQQALHYTPSFGSHFFWYKGRPLMFERLQNQQQVNFQSASEREELYISCFGRNPQILKDLLLEARQMYLKKDERKTLIYRSSSGSSYGEPYWQRSMSRPNRPFSTVILNEKVKQDLIDDAADYLNPATRRWYANRGIPYRRGYLLHGPPGTGKSSLSLALAGYFRMKIYIVSLSSVNATEEGLTSLFSNLPTRCLVLLEDIDTAGLTHTREESGSTPRAAPPTASLSTSGAPSPPPSGRLSLSGLLNILDGVASQEGRLLVMTTNHIEKLDKALIRPGRVDMIIPFGLADKSMSEAIFRAIYAPFEGETSSTDATDDADDDDSPKLIESDEVLREKWAKQHAEISEYVEGLAKKFAANIPELEFSPAEIQGLLLRHKRSPEEVIKVVDEWVIQTRKDKKEKELKEAEKRRKALEEEEEEKRKQEAEKKEKAEVEDEERKKNADKKEEESQKQDDDGAKKEDVEQKKDDEAETGKAVEKNKMNDEAKDGVKGNLKPEQMHGSDDKKNGASDSEYERL